jgi:arylsulfatase A-like enzyme
MMDAHTPYGYWPEHLRAIRGDADVDHSINPGLEDRVVEGEPADPDVVDTYDACVRRTDAEIGRLLEAVDDDTTVVVTGDHGEEFGRFGGFHQASLYSSMTDVPILVRPADGTALADADTPVQHLDIPATLLAAAGADVPDHWEGDALGSAAAHERTEDWPVFFSLSHEQTAVRAGRWKLMEEAGRRQLFDLVDGEGETTPSEDAERREELGGLLDGYQRLLRDERVGEGQGDLEEAHRDGELSPEIEENLEDLGYL